MKNILITGLDGQLGSELKAISHNYNYNFFFTDRNILNITDQKTIEEFCHINNITHIINCAAYTAVDKAEGEKELAMDINYYGVQYLSNISKKLNISLIHISTDSVYEINCKPYKENDKTNPINIYSKTKLDGEKSMCDINPINSIIIRTSWVYSSFGNNFVKTMLKLGKQKNEIGVVYDQIGTPTYAKDLANIILDILPKIKNNQVEIYNYSNEGVCSWYDFAKAIFELSSTNIMINAIETKDYPTKATRPNYSILNKSKIKNTFDVSIPYWKDSLAECIKILGENNNV